MPIESFSYISSLNSSNPGGSDGILQGDDHIRGIKATLLASFGSISGATTVTHTRLNELQSGALTGDVSVAGNFSCAGQITGNGSAPTGMIADFLAVPTGWLELNGQTLSRATYATLFALGLPGMGAGNGTTTFTLPDLTDRYRRQRGTNAVAATLANQNKTHSHTAATTTTNTAAGSHNHGGASGGQSATHTHSGTTSSNGAHGHGGSTGGQSADHSHQSYGTSSIAVWTGAGSYSGYSSILTYGNSTTTGTSNDHTHGINAEPAHDHSFTSGNASVDHTHTIATQADHNHTAASTTTITADGGSESRPDTYVVITCIKS